MMMIDDDSDDRPHRSLVAVTGRGTMASTDSGGSEGSAAPSACQIDRSTTPTTHAPASWRSHGKRVMFGVGIVATGMVRTLEASLEQIKENQDSPHMLRRALLDEMDDDMTEARSRRVMGLGLGVFFLILSFLITCIMCICGQTGFAVRPAYWNAAAAQLFGLTVIILFCAEVSPRYRPSSSASLKVYNTQFVGIITVFTLLAFASFAGILALVCYDACQPVQAVVIEDPNPIERRRTHFGALKVQTV